MDLLFPADPKAPLWTACARGYAFDAQRLLMEGADANERGGDNTTPLMMAWDEDIVQILLAHGASVNATDARGMTALMTAVRTKNLQVVTLLLWANADTCIVDKFSRTALVHALPPDFSKRKGDTYFLVEKLVKTCRPIINLPDSEGRTPLFHAIGYCSCSVIECLILHGADVNSPGIVAEAAAQNSIPKVRLLLAHGADPNVMHPNGTTALIQAARYDNEAIVSSLLRSGADPTLSDNGGTPWVHAVRDNAYKVLPLLESKCFEMIFRLNGNTSW